MQLWSKSVPLHEAIEKFTTGKDRELDLLLAPFDVLGSMAHITMLAKVGLLPKQELAPLLAELKGLYHTILQGSYHILPGVEDIHSQIEFDLTSRLGDLGKKIHSGRSRNDQVLVDIKLFMREGLEQVVHQVELLFRLLLKLSETHKNTILPGYTHFQVAMPSSFGLWFAAYAESLADDLYALLAAYRVVNKNPLGSAAGYGSSFPLDRSLTTTLLGFDDLDYNVVYAQMNRGKSDIIVSNALSSVAYTLNKLSADVVLYVSQNFGFLSFPDEVMEGSSIMPHKKNPDVFELIRAKTNQVKGTNALLHTITTNLPSGYHRDWQVLKEYTLPSFELIKDCLSLTTTMLSKVMVNEQVHLDGKYTYMYSVDRVNELVLAGVAFRDAYKQVGEEIANNTFVMPSKVLHTHEGSMGNLCNDKIAERLSSTMSQFDFAKKNAAIDRLLASA